MRVLHFIFRQQAQPLIQRKVKLPAPAGGERHFCMPNAIPTQPTIEPVKKPVDRMGEDQSELIQRAEAL